MNSTTPKERPILFNGDMVRAILDGRKTQTRRALKPKTLEKLECAARIGECMSLESDIQDWGYVSSFCPYGQPGDRLWVRETWADVNTCEGPAIAYRSDGGAQTWHEFSRTFGPDYGSGPSMDYESYPGNYCMWIDDLLNGAPDHSWRPSIFMPRWASRITLEITDVRVERLQEISEDGSYDEGTQAWLEHDKNLPTYSDGTPAKYNSMKKAFAAMWGSINGTDSWDANPWVWVVEFRKL